MRPRPLSRSADVLLCAVVPALLYWVTRSYYQVPPLGNAMNHDPDWYYLGNAMRVASGRGIFTVGHPGIPLSLLVGALVWLRVHLWPIQPGAGLVEEVLANSPAYQEYLGTTFLLLNSLALWLFGLWLRRLPLARAYVLLSQASLLISPMVLWYGSRVMPEAIAPIAGLITGTLLLAHARGSTAGRPLPGDGLLVGALTFAASIKLNFLAYLVFAGTRPWRRAGAILACSAFLFWLATFLFDPLRRDVFWSFHQSVLTHQGRYALGAPGLPGPELLARNFWELWGESRLMFWQFLGLVAFALGCAGIAWRWPRGPARRFVCLFLAMVLLLFAGQLKQSGARYALPAYALLPSLLALIWWREERALVRLGLVAVVFLAALLSRPLYLEDLLNHASGRIAVQEQQARVEAELRAHPGCMHLFEDAVLNYRWANFAADAESGQMFAAELHALYPRTWVYSDGLGYFRTYGRHAVSPADFARELAAAPCVLLYPREPAAELVTRFPFSLRKWRTLVKVSFVELMLSGRDP